jgi:hypothetical protein
MYGMENNDFMKLTINKGTEAICMTVVPTVVLLKIHFLGGMF